MRRILIADDSPPVRRALVQLLEGAYSVIEAEDGEAAFTLALELRPDLIILDLAMPVMDGLTAAREISNALPEIPILMYTMHWTPSLEVAAHKSGIRKLIPKVQSQTLLATIKELLSVPGELPPAAEPASIPDLEVPPATGDSVIIALAEEPARQVAPDIKPKKIAS
jgi:CheY-like chemotaxis protein